VVIDREKVREARSAGKSYQRIARELKVSVGVVWAAAKT